MNAPVRNIVLERARATGVVLMSGEVLRAREVIVSSGAIGSPKLLLQSGIGPADHLKQAGVAVRHDLPGVGGNLQDHLDLFVIAECTGDHTYDGVAKLHRTLAAGLQYMLLGSGPVASSLFETGASGTPIHRHGRRISSFIWGLDRASRPGSKSSGMPV